MGLNFGLFKTPKHKVFNYQPLFYDERKEAMKERLERLEEEKLMEKGISTYKPGKHIRSNFRKNLYDGKKSSGEGALQRIIMIICIALLLAALFYFADLFSFLLSL